MHERAARRVEREEQRHRREHHEPVGEERSQLGAAAEDPRAADEEEREHATRHGEGPAGKLSDGPQLRADDGQRSPVEVRAQRDLVADGELLVV